MNILYIECNMGAAGDMLMSALAEVHPNSESVIERLNGLNIPGVKYEMKKTVKCGIIGTHIDVSVSGVRESEHIHDHAHGHMYEHNHIHESGSHTHAGMKDIEAIISGLNVSDSVKENALAVYRLIAEAEGKAHGRDIDQIHFHEVGTMDAVADVVGVCMMLEEINPGRIIVSPIHVGCGQVRCAHGILPVPAPATAYILRDVPTYGGEIRGELCTPTGAALLRHFADEFAPMPVMRVSKIGYGMGTKDFEAANCVRVMLGSGEDKTDTICKLCCNIDDMTAEEIGFAVGALLDEGAADVFTTPVVMKKNRPGTMLTCLCSEELSGKFAEFIFKYTSTIGIRRQILNRYILDRRTENVETKYGLVRMKISSGYGTEKAKAEYDDIEKLAKKNRVAPAEIYKEIKRR